MHHNALYVFTHRPYLCPLKAHLFRRGRREYDLPSIFKRESTPPYFPALSLLAEQQIQRA